MTIHPSKSGSFPRAGAIRAGAFHSPSRRAACGATLLWLCCAGGAWAQGAEGAAAALAGKLSTRLETFYERIVLKGGQDSGPAPEAVTGAAAGGEPWQITKEDRSVRATLARWAQRDGWQLVWDLPVDYPLVAPAALGGSLEDAVGAVIRALQGVTPPPRAVFYDGNRVVRILPRGVQ